MITVKGRRGGNTTYPFAKLLSFARTASLGRPDGSAARHVPILLAFWIIGGRDDAVGALLVGGIEAARPRDRVVQVRRDRDVGGFDVDGLIGVLAVTGLYEVAFLAGLQRVPPLVQAVNGAEVHGGERAWAQDVVVERVFVFFSLLVATGDGFVVQGLEPAVFQQLADDRILVEIFEVVLRLVLSLRLLSGRWLVRGLLDDSIVPKSDYGAGLLLCGCDGGGSGGSSHLERLNRSVESNPIETL